MDTTYVPAELSCLGCLPAVLRGFKNLTGWSLAYAAVRPDTGTNHPQNTAQDNKPQEEIIQTLSIPENTSHLLPFPLTPEMVNELDTAQEEWIPVEGYPYFTLTDTSLAETSHTSGSVSAAPIGFLHLKQGEISEPSILEKQSMPSHLAMTYPQARQMAVALADLLSELHSTRLHLWSNAAQLAVTECKLQMEQKETSDFPARFHRLLQYGAQQTGVQAIGVYLLDDTDTYLKLRASYGLPLDQLTSPVRLLERSQADLEAMNGQVVIFDSRNTPHSFMPPEDFLLAICLPLTTDRAMMGTVWFFSNQENSFSDQTIRDAELMADHISLDLEREAVFRRYSRSLEYKSELRSLVNYQRSQTPVRRTWDQHWDVAGWTSPRSDLETPGCASDKIYGGFYDWFSLPGDPAGKLVITLGDVFMPGLQRALVCTSVRAVLHAHASHVQSPAELVQHVNRTLWNLSSSDTRVSLFCAVLNPETSQVEYVSHGPLRIMHTRDGNAEILTTQSCMLGSSGNISTQTHWIKLKKEEGLVIFNDGAFRNRIHINDLINGHILESLLTDHSGNPPHTAQEMLCVVRRFLQTPQNIRSTENGDEINTPPCITMTRQKTDRAVLCVRRS